MKDVALVVPACYQDIFSAFVDSLWDHREAWPFARKILVRDGENIRAPEGWEWVQGPDPYVMPRNINLGLAAAGRMDVVMASDDTQFTEVGSLEKLQRVAYRDERNAIVSPQIDGGCGIWEQRTDSGYHEVVVTRIAFIFIYVKRAIVDLIGGWDEQFVTYGHDDFDYCERTKRAGKRALVTDQVVVKHGYHAPCMNTYSRKGTADTVEGERIFRAKWGTHEF